MEKYIMAIDEGTTSARAILFDHESHVVSVAQKEFTQYFEKPGWVAQDGNEIWLAVQAVMAQCIINSGIKPNQVVAIGITNQRETAIIWNKETGLPICKAIVWQSRQTEDICDDLIRKGYNQLFASKTGLRIDPYFSATKYRWMLDHIEGAQQLAMEGKLLAGTIDSWLIWKLSNGQAHVTDYSNASRTLLYNIYEKCWDKQLCDILNIPMHMLPQVKDSSCIYANTDKSLFFGHRVPISGVAGDQQAALFGQGCFNKGDAKNTYGTGGFLLMNTGEEPLVSQDGLLTTIAWGINGQVYYALEGSIFVSGSAIQWLRDQMKFFASSKDSEQFANNASKDNQVIVVPAFVGLGAPYWDDKARGAIFGITRGTTQQDITQATLESLAYQTKDVLDAMVKTCNTHIDSLQVDGGASANNYLMQFQADILQCHIKRNAMLETTALGAARLAGLAVGYWKQDDFKVQDFREFKPLISKQQSDMKYDKWLKAVAATQLFTK